MTTSRRHTGVAVGAVLALSMLGGCASQPAGSAVDPGRAAVAPTGAPKTKASKPSARPQPASREYRAVAVTGDFAGDPDVDRFIGRMNDGHGFSREYLAGVLSQAERKQWILDQLDRDRPTGAPPRPGGWSRYREKFLTDRHIAGGVEFWRENARELERAARKYGVPPEYIVGIIGVETFYGRITGTFRVLDALSTLAFDYPPRSSYFRGELEQFLLLSREEDVPPLTVKGSYAGAMGYPQFMPRSYRAYAVDGDGDGRRDLWNSWDDVIASIANYLAAHGWRGGEPVLAAADLPWPDDSVDLVAGSITANETVGSLRHKGLVFESSMPEEAPAVFIEVAGSEGPERLAGFHNFSVITRYNRSVLYALAVNELGLAAAARLPTAESP